ncbi:MAG TPA: sugar ABC transporter ATP-binding protein [Vicinamibacterales bacterium]|nr:sugar ABC transporter ATP-binding protein [Vicinamibacterales bacterium]
MSVPLLHMSAISKRFPGVVALDSVDFDLAAGEIVALVGENGAGKSTLMKILAGIIRADSGAIHIDGTPVTMPGPGDAARLGIAVIHQERELIDTLDVAGNVFLGREPTRGGRLRLLDRRRMHAETQQQLARIGVQIPARTPLRDLSAAQQQLVSIVRAISMNARMLILDEPTSSLPSTDAERLFDVLRELRRSGTAIVYISHRLKEIEILADRAVVLRDGRNAGTLARDAISHDRLVQLMVGRVVDKVSPRVEAPAGPAVLRIERLRTGRYPDVEISLDIHRAEVLGIAGLVGAGRTELAEAICGVGPRRSGEIVLDGRPLAIHSARDAIRHGICLVPEDRRRCGVVAPMSVRENVTLPALSSYARLGLIGRSAEATAVRRMAAELTVKAASIESPVATLSGGNQQKVVLAKWLALRPRVLVFDEPTQGVDVGAKAEIHRLIRTLAQEGAAVVLISSDMEEIVAESDRVAVMHDGRITGVLPRSRCTPESIMQLAVA